MLREHRTARLLLVPALLSAIALVAASCGGGGTPSTQGGGGEATIGDTTDQGSITIVMDEYSFSPSTITVKAGQEFDLKIRNIGNDEHELMIGLPVGGGPEWKQDLFGRMDVQVMGGEGHLEGFEGMVEEEGEEGGHEGMQHGAEVEVEAGNEVTLHVRVPADAAGSWEIGCFLPNHYERGMKGTLVVTS
ncbi:MAG TPA: cupredoxin domain-containing protein [Actinomycetota bacterium]|nr:cupredoxin domain-containing protein [Actinomycetota bacterium]